MQEGRWVRKGEGARRGCGGEERRGRGIFEVGEHGFVDFFIKKNYGFCFMKMKILGFIRFNDEEV